MQGIHRGPVNSPHKWPVMRKMFPFDDVIMMSGHGLISQLILGMQPQAKQDLLLIRFTTKRSHTHWQCAIIVFAKMWWWDTEPHQKLYLIFIREMGTHIKPSLEVCTLYRTVVTVATWHHVFFVNTGCLMALSHYPKQYWNIDTKNSRNTSKSSLGNNIHLKTAFF